MRDWKESSAASPRTAWPADETPGGSVHCSDAADPKPLQLFVPPSDVKGAPEKLPTKPRKSRNWKQSFVRRCRLSMLSANAGNTGTNRPHQAEISTVGRYTFAGRLISRLTLP